jgi:hypothetical protein
MLKREVYHNDNGYCGLYRLNTEVAGCHICSEDASVSSVRGLRRAETMGKERDGPDRLPCVAGSYYKLPVSC